MLNDKRIFITGGAGFIGSTIAGRLLDQNVVTAFDNFARDALSSSGLLDHPTLRVVRGEAGVRRQVLQRVRRAGRRRSSRSGGRRALRRARRLHPQAPRRAHPDLAGGPRG